MKNILLASACALLLSSNAFAQQAQAVKTATQAASEAFGGAAASAGRSAPVAGRTATPKAPTGRTARTQEVRATRTTTTGGSLNAAAANSAGVSVSGKRTPAPSLAPVATATQAPKLAQPTRTASVPAAQGIFAPTCTAAQKAAVTPALQAAIGSSQKFSGVNCGEDISTAAEGVAVNVVKAVEAAPAANDNAELTAAQKQIELARPGISPREARSAAAQVMCSTATHQACVAVKPSTGICQLAKTEGIL